MAREPFTKLYIDQGMTLKDAATRMRLDHNFDATPRQWENRIGPEKWGLQKYANRDDRLKVIQGAGWTLHDIGCRGRRKSISADGSPLLQDDRNLRRFAKRELSRNARRHSRSVSASSSEIYRSTEVSNSAASSPPAYGSYSEAAIHMTEPQVPPELSIPPPMATSCSPSLATFESTQSEPHMSVPMITYSAHGDSGMPDANLSLDDPYQSVHTLLGQPTFHDVPMSEAFANSIDDSDPSFPQMDWNRSLGQLPFEVVPHAFNVGGETFGSAHATLSTEPVYDNTQHDVLPADSTINKDVHDLMESAGIMGIHDDPTYADVHDLMDAKDGQIMASIDACLGVCEGTRDPNVMIHSLRMLRTSVQAEVLNSRRIVRGALKDIATTQRRAAQNICLSIKRKRQIQQTQLQHL